MKRYDPRLAYVPTRLPTGTDGYGFYFGKWGVGAGGELRRPKAGDRARAGSGFGISFNQKGNSVPGLVAYWLGSGNCQSQGSAMHQFRLNGAAVNWSATYEDQEAWSCVRRGGTRFVVSVTRSVAGDDNLHSRQGRKDALELACMLAYIRPAR